MFSLLCLPSVCRADPRFDADDSTIFYNVYDPNDRNRESTSWCVSLTRELVPVSPSPTLHTHTHTHTLGGNFTVSLYTQHHPYGSSTRNVFDPNLGRHDDFAVVGPYIFAAVCVCVCVCFCECYQALRLSGSLLLLPLLRREPGNGPLPVGLHHLHLEKGN